MVYYRIQYLPILQMNILRPSDLMATRMIVSLVSSRIVQFIYIDFNCEVLVELLSD